MKVKKSLVFVFMVVSLLFATLQVYAETVYREKYEGIGPYTDTGQELNVEGTELYYAKISGYKTIDEFSENEKVTLYAGGGRTLTRPNFLKETYLKVGWFERPVTTLYTLDGRQKDFYNEEVEAQCTVGWYKEKPVLLYTLDGRKKYFLPKDVEPQCTVGWYKTAPVTLYTRDGRSKVFPADKVDAQRSVGWYYKSELDKINELEKLAKTFYIGQKVWMQGTAYTPVGYVTSVSGGKVYVLWDYFYDWESFRVYDQQDILYAERFTGIELGKIYGYSADKVKKYK